MGGCADCGGERAIEAGLHTVGIHGGQQDFTGAEFFAALGPFDGVDPRPASSAVRGDLPTGRCRHRLRRDRAGVDPIGDVDVEMRQKRLDRSTQQSGVVTRHWRDDQEPFLA